MWWQTKKRHCMWVKPGCVQGNGKDWKDRNFLEDIMTIILTTKLTSVSQKAWGVWGCSIECPSAWAGHCCWNWPSKVGQGLAAGWHSWTGPGLRQAPGLSAGRDWTLLGREGRVNPFGSSELLDQPRCHLNPHLDVPYLPLQFHLAVLCSS